MSSSSAGGLGEEGAGLGSLGKKLIGTRPSKNTRIKGEIWEKRGATYGRNGWVGENKYLHALVRRVVRVGRARPLEFVRVDGPSGHVRGRAALSTRGRLYSMRVVVRVGGGEAHLRLIGACHLLGAPPAVGAPPHRVDQSALVRLYELDRREEAWEREHFGDGEGAGERGELGERELRKALLNPSAVVALRLAVAREARRRRRRRGRAAEEA